jgi:hypothetical protein
LVELELRHGLDHILALLLEGKDAEQREEIEGQLWADPEREAKILTALGRNPSAPSDEVTVIEE